MIPSIKTSIWQQFGAAIDMLDNAIEALTDETAQRRCRFDWGEVSFAELLLYNMRYVQEHAAQLNLFLGQNGVSAPGWVTIAEN